MTICTQRSEPTQSSYTHTHTHTRTYTQSKRARESKRESKRAQGNWEFDLQHVCANYSSQGSFPRNLWHKLPLSHYLMTKHSHILLPCLLLNFTLRAMAQEKPLHCMQAHTSTEKRLFFAKALTLCERVSNGLKSRSDDLESSNLFMKEVRAGGVIIPCFQVANTQLSMALFVTLK